jgi:hypothetical protein
MVIHPRRAALIAIAVSLSYFVSSYVVADDLNQKAVITLDETLKVPGATLDAGAYIFSVETKGSDTVVRIARASDNKLMTTAKVMRVARPADAEGLTIEVANPRGDAEWPTLKGWSFMPPGASYEFVFSKADERRLNDTTEIPISPPAS